MGGKWEFKFDKEKFDPADLTKYQNFLIVLKKRYELKIGTEIDECDRSGCFFYSGTYPPDDNIFATFTYTCERHSKWTDQHQYAGWYLIWDPTANVDEKVEKAKLHAKCAPYSFKKFSNKIQQDLVNKFPKYFKKYFANGLSGYKKNDSDSSFEALFYDSDCDSDCLYYLIPESDSDSE